MIRKSPCNTIVGVASMADSASSSLPVFAVWPLRVAGITIKGSNGNNDAIARQLTNTEEGGGSSGSSSSGAEEGWLWRVLFLCAAAEQRAHEHFGIPIHLHPAAAALVRIDLSFTFNQRANLAVIGPLTTSTHNKNNNAHQPLSTLVRSLQVLKIASNDYDESAALSAFGALAMNLQDLTFYYCGLTSVRGLEGRCEYVRKVNLSGCKQHLTNLEGLEHHMYLEEVDATWTSISSVEPLRTCPALTKAVLFFCKQLTTLDGLQSHSRLKEVDASHTPIASVEPLRTCPALAKVKFSGCRQLTSLEGLERHQWLVNVNAANTAISSVEPLYACPFLKKVNIDRCPHLPDKVEFPSSVEIIQ